jgi:hypothetical protein
VSVDRARKDAAEARSLLAELPRAHITSNTEYAWPGTSYWTNKAVTTLRSMADSVDVLVSELEAAQKERDELAATLALADGLYLLHKVEHDDDPESPADTTGFCAANCKACIFNVARGKEDRRDPTKVAATPTPTKENA